MITTLDAPLLLPFISPQVSTRKSPVRATELGDLLGTESVGRSRFPPHIAWRPYLREAGLVRLGVAAIDASLARRTETERARAAPAQPVTSDGGRRSSGLLTAAAIAVSLCVALRLCPSSHLSLD